MISLVRKIRGSRELRDTLMPLYGALSRLHLLHRNRSFVGAFPSREAALAAVPRRALVGYNHECVAPVAIADMQRLKEWDYPILFWLERLIRDRPGEIIHLVDAGGHTGTKYIAFHTRIDLIAVDWLVYDLPPMVALGQQIAAKHGLPIRFTSDPSKMGRPDILLCSGLFQYYESRFADLLDLFDVKPANVLLNKVQLREGKSVVTLEKIGPAYVPYMMRDKVEFLSELDRAGYRVVDRWQIAALSHRIASHPELGSGESWGFALRLKNAEATDHDAGASISRGES